MMLWKLMFATAMIATVAAQCTLPGTLGNGIVGDADGTGGACIAGAALNDGNTCAVKASTGYTSDTGTTAYSCDGTTLTSATVTTTGCSIDYYQSAGTDAATGVCTTCTSGKGTLATANFGASTTTCTCSSSYTGADCATPPACTIPVLGYKLATGNCTVGADSLAAGTSCTVVAETGYETSGTGTYTCHATDGSLTATSDLAVTGCSTDYYQSAGTSLTDFVCTTCTSGTSITAAVPSSTLTKCKANAVGSSPSSAVTIPSCTANPTAANTKVCTCGVSPAVVSCVVGKWCWADKCQDAENPCKSGGAYCGPLDGSGSYMTEFAGACSTCSNGPTSCLDMIDNFITLGKCHATCASGWTDTSRDAIATQFKCTADETTKMKAEVDKSAGKTTPAANQMSDATIITNNLLVLVTAVIAASNVLV